MKSFGDWFREGPSVPAKDPAAEKQESLDANDGAEAWLITCTKPGKRSSYATIDSEDTFHWPVDQWTSIKKKPLFTTKDLRLRVEVECLRRLALDAYPNLFWYPDRGYMTTCEGCGNMFPVEDLGEYAEDIRYCNGGPRCVP